MLPKIFDVTHCFLCCWQETASESNFSDDSFPFYNIHDSLKKCNLSANVLFWSKCNIVHVFVVFYSECRKNTQKILTFTPIILFTVDASSLSFAVREWNSWLAWIMSLCGAQLSLDFVEVSLLIFVSLLPISCAVTYFLNSFLRFLNVQGLSLFLYYSSLPGCAWEILTVLTTLSNYFQYSRQELRVIVNVFQCCCMLLVPFRSM